VSVNSSVRRPLAGLASVLLIGAIVAVAITLFNAGFTRTVPLTVLSPRAGLVMYPDAKVKMLGVPIGKVESIGERPDGQAEIRLAMDPDKLRLVPANVGVDIGSTTVFGAKFIQLVPPADPSPQPLAAGQVLQSQSVTVEFNTIFEHLTSVLARVQPEKLNETLGALATAFRGRGDRTGQTFTNLDALLAKLEPSLPSLSDDLTLAPEVANVYADSVGALLDTAKNATQVGQTLLDEERNVDTLLVSLIGLGEVGQQVLGDNGDALTNVLHLLVPTTALTDRYHPALTCAIQGLAFMHDTPRLTDTPGLEESVGFLLGAERYRYPHNLPKVAATGGPQCGMLPAVPPGVRPPYVVANVGANPFEYGNEGIVLNIDRLKQALFGPIDGPPRNSAQIGQGPP
jgi:phospholipid/cholesterol/gamma-HCH transport system substrate-binding protein